MKSKLILKIPREKIKVNWINKYVPFEYLASIILGVIILRIGTLQGINNTLSFLLYISLTFTYIGIKIKGKKWKRWLFKDGLILTIGVLFFGVIYADVLITDAHAQFLNGAESFVKNSLCSSLAQAGAGGGGAGGAITNENDMVGMVGLFFTVIRAIMILYIVVSIMKVFNAAREDEDWKTLAKTPLIVVVAIVIGDALIALVTGGGAGANINAVGGATVCGGGD